MPRPVHFEIHAGDAERAIAFYTALFSWHFAKWGEMPYWLIKTGEASQPGIDGGLVPRRGDAPGSMAAVNGWVCTVDVPDVDAYIAKGTALGSEIALPKMAIPGVGYLVYLKDTEGNIFGMMQNDPAAR